MHETQSKTVVTIVNTTNTMEEKNCEIPKNKIHNNSVPREVPIKLSDLLHYMYSVASRDEDIVKPLIDSRGEGDQI